MGDVEGGLKVTDGFTGGGEVAYLDSRAGDEPPFDPLDDVDQETNMHNDQVDGQHDQHQATRERFPRLDLAALLSVERPAREWLWWRLIPLRAAVATVAPAGTGKSLLILALMIAIARGDRAFAGLRITNRRVFLVDMENTEDDLADRFRDLGVTAAEVASLDNLVFLHLPMLPPGHRRRRPRTGSRPRRL
jgi:hypothetical protein